MNDLNIKNLLQLDQFKSYKDIMYIRWFIELHYDMMTEGDKLMTKKIL